MRKKRIIKLLSAVLGLSVLVTSIPVYGVQAASFDEEDSDLYAAASSGYCGSGENEEDVQWNYDSETKTLTISGTGSMMENWSEYPWTKLKGNTSKIVIEDGVTNVGRGAFQGFLSEEVSLGNTVEKIGDDAFYISKIRSIEIPGSVKTIGDRAFRECLDLDFVVLDEGVENIGDSAFERVAASSLKHRGIIYLPSTITHISGTAFQSDWVNNLFVYGKNNVAKDYFEFANATYIDAETKVDLSQSEIKMQNSLSDEYDYTGQPICPLESITYSGNQAKKDGVNVPIELIPDIDYSISYTDNIEPGIATIKINGIGYFSGEKIINFNIFKLLEDCNIDLSYSEVLYNGQSQIPEVSIKYKEDKLEKDTDYSIKCSNNIEEGKATVTITGINNFKGVISKTFTIYKNNISAAEITLSDDSYLYDGTAKEPEVTVSYGGQTLEKDKDYNLSFNNNTEEGNATVIITGINSFKGVISKTFTIYKNNISAAEITLTEDSYLYDGTAKEPEVTVSCDGQLLEKDKDYDLSFRNNTEEGNAIVTIIGIGQYKGIKSSKFSIYKKHLNSQNVTLNYNRYLYDGREAKPEVTVRYKDEMYQTIIIH